MVADGLIAFVPLNKIAPLALVSVWPSVIVKSPPPPMINELIEADAATAVAPVIHVLVPAVIALLVNSSVKFKGRYPLPAT